MQVLVRLHEVCKSVLAQSNTRQKSTEHEGANFMLPGVLGT